MASKAQTEVRPVVPVEWDKDHTPRQTHREAAQLIKTLGLEIEIPPLHEAEDWWIEQARATPAAFMWYVLGLKPAKHHLEWFQLALGPGGDRCIWIGPRGSAKTTASLALLAWWVGHHPWSSNVILSVSSAQAAARLEMLAKLLEHNLRYRRVFPHIVPDESKSWNRSQLSLRDSSMAYNQWLGLVRRLGDAKSPGLMAASLQDSKLVGARVAGKGMLLMDDLLDSKTGATAQLRNAAWERLAGDILPILMPGSRVLHVTTRWSDGDADNDYDGGDIAIRQMASGQYRYSIVQAVKRDDRGRLRSYWPELYPLSKLGATLDAIGSTWFKLAYMNTATALSGAVFLVDTLRNPLPDQLPVFEKLYVSVDPALSAKSSADETAIATIGVARNPRTRREQLYVLDIVSGRWQPEGTCQIIADVFDKAWNVFGEEPILLIEAVAAQELFLTVLTQQGRVPMHRVETHKPQVDKVLRARPLAAMAERWDLFLDTESLWYPKFLSQAVELPTGPSDDMIDAVSAVAYRESGTIAKGALAPKLHLVKIRGLQ